MGQMIATPEAAAALSDPARALPVTLASLLAGRQVWQWQAVIEIGRASCRERV